MISDYQRFFFSHSASFGVGARSTWDTTRPESREESLIDRTHNWLKAEGNLWWISMQMTSNIIQTFFMVGCHTNICYPIHLACYSLSQWATVRARIRGFQELSARCAKCRSALATFLTWKVEFLVAKMFAKDELLWLYEKRKLWRNLR